jgi:hypothetical protein
VNLASGDVARDKRGTGALWALARPAYGVGDRLQGMFQAPANGMSQSLRELDDRILRRVSRVSVRQRVRELRHVCDSHQKFGDEHSADVHASASVRHIRTGLAHASERELNYAEDV